MRLSLRLHRSPWRNGGEPGGAVYVLLEEARLRCEQLLADAAGAERRRLHRLRSELGMAGYWVSGELVPGKRLQLLEHARRRSLATAAADRTVALERLVRVCARVLERESELNGEPSPDHVELVHRHLVAARALLDSPKDDSRWQLDRDRRAPR